MKLEIHRWVGVRDIEIGDVVLWTDRSADDVHVEIESITRTKEGWELSGHNRLRPASRAIVIRVGDERLRVAPTAEEESGLSKIITKALQGVDNGQWSVILKVSEEPPLNALGRPAVGDVVTGAVKTESTGKVDGTADATVS